MQKLDTQSTLCNLSFRKGKGLFIDCAFCSINSPGGQTKSTQRRIVHHPACQYQGLNSPAITEHYQYELKKLGFF